MTILVVQCRISSTRLPGKALLPLGNKTVLDWTLASMRKVKADKYIVATDEESLEELKPVSLRNDFEIIAGPLEDVLERFCLVIEKTKADTVIRATADNPFLFYEAASALLEQYNHRQETSKCDYITWTGLPHGSGVEIFNAHSLLRAKELTSEAYDHEHVGPALYNHPENFTSVMLNAPEQWNYPDLRTTIDTAADYRRAVWAVEALGGEGPYSCEQIVKTFEDENIRYPVLCVPCVKKGRGTGHLRRCLSIAVSLHCDVYIPEDADLEEKDELLESAAKEGFSPSQIVTSLPEKGQYALILTDAFVLDRELALKLSSVSKLVSIDEGSLNTDLCDYLLDIIPSYGLQRPSNVSDPSYVTLPEHKREKKLETAEEIKNILVTVGGEDPADLVVPAAVSYASLGYSVTAIVQDPEKAQERAGEELSKKIKFIKPVHNLREKLYKYEVVVTHYGFTAFEAVAAGCGVVLLGTSALHVNLANKYGFKCLSAQNINETGALYSLSDVKELYPDSPFALRNGQKNDLAKFVRLLSKGQRLECPVCTSSHQTFEDQIVCRTNQRTFRRCNTCGMLYMSYTTDSQNTSYDEKYFFEGYKKQYGKTYLDDFASIKAQCVRRISHIDYIYRNSHKLITPTVLDIGCAFGPFMDAANDSGWQVFGTDVSKEAVSYVQEKLHFPASCARFPLFDSAAEFGVSEFDAVTMWYVIEHFKDLDSVLKAVSKILKPGGVFAFSTPSASGVSGKFNTQSFFAGSPADHYSLWEPVRCASILRKYGFKVEKIVSTGHHPERFPNLQGAKPNSIKWALYSASSHFFGLGDTFEVYCKKEKDL
jgi:spore coat polysaccharide biosynthesis protein SpsF (cytidylyltransferase family)/2-polyprenyl-3-methyl-5-hydroxy-6-metoxy-1,4-benzoquinol methylase/spore coat polysaccharide biosynthesis predicted glycosyltransferase SpsG